MDERIIQYYRLCDVRGSHDRDPPLVDRVDKKMVSAIFTDREITLMYRVQDDAYRVREDVIGGGKPKTVHKITILC